MKRFALTFGCGDFGRLGHGSTAPELVPRVIAAVAADSISQIVAAGAHTTILTGEGKVFTTGLNDAGQLGHSPDENSVQVPRQVDLPDAVTAITAGHFHTVALTSTGELWSWGRNAAGQLGLGGRPSRDERQPQKVASLDGVQVTAIAAGAEHTLALAESDGKVFSWGSPAGGRLGARAEWKWLATGRQPEPRLVRGLAGISIASIAAGHQHSGAVSRDMAAYLWGDNRFSQLGLQAEEYAVPTSVLQLQNIRSLALGGLHSLAIPHSNHILSWGANQNGVLGLGHHGDMNVSTPTLVPDVYASQASAGWKHNLAVGLGGQLLSWGWGGSVGTQSMYDSDSSTGGQLGLDTEFDSWSPTAVPQILGPGGALIPQEIPSNEEDDAKVQWRAVQVSCGFNHSTAIVEMSEEVASHTQANL